MGGWVTCEEIGDADHEVLEVGGDVERGEGQHGVAEDEDEEVGGG